mgnify:CR=1 FL=1
MINDWWLEYDAARKIKHNTTKPKGKEEGWQTMTDLEWRSGRFPSKTWNSGALWAKATLVVYGKENMLVRT